MCRLSLAWGMPQTEIEQTVSARDLDEMAAYWASEPWGAFRDNIHAAQICALIANVNRKRTTPPFSHEDFMLMNAEERAQKRRRGVVAFFTNLATKRQRDDEGT